MHLAELKDLISYLAIISNLMLFLSGILICKQYVNLKTTGETTVLPFIMGVLSCNLWLLYGIVKPENCIVFVNTIGIALMILYVIVFYIFAFKKKETQHKIVTSSIIAVLINGYFCVEEDNELLMCRLGLVACFFTLLMIGAPMTKLYYVFKSKCTDCLPFPLIVMSFFVSLFWFLYGMIVEDLYILIPNIIGGLLSTVQLSVFLIIPSKSYSPLPTKSMLA